MMTDILAGNRANILTILVDPISETESKQVKMKRPLEKMIKKIFHIARKIIEPGLRIPIAKKRILA